MTIAVIAAMEEEIVPLKALLNQVKTEKIANFEYNVGFFYNKKIILLKSGIGKVNAAMSATLLLEKFKPEYVINTGSAGGLNHTLKTGDIVVSERVCHHDVDITPFDYEPGQVPGLPTFFLPDELLVTLTKSQLALLSDVSCQFGLISSGDQFLSRGDDIERVKQSFPGVMACDMEAASVAQVCHIFSVPFVIVRAISDIPGQNNAVDFKLFLQQAVKNYTWLLSHLLQKI